MCRVYFAAHLPLCLATENWPQLKWRRILSLPSSSLPTSHSYPLISSSVRHQRCSDTSLNHQGNIVRENNITLRIGLIFEFLVKTNLNGHQSLFHSCTRIPGISPLPSSFLRLVSKLLSHSVLGLDPTYSLMKMMLFPWWLSVFVFSWYFTPC